ncbi:MAG: hypothetical protein CMJ75_21255, partial [Planctomycetaceae bacterium]|nr:hypothetical protein [Planctomycetaceae bacterium]
GPNTRSQESGLADSNAGGTGRMLDSLMASVIYHGSVIGVALGRGGPGKDTRSQWRVRSKV